MIIAVRIDENIKAFEGVPKLGCTYAKGFQSLFSRESAYATRP
jgi:hypothetical protein